MRDGVLQKFTQFGSATPELTAELGGFIDKALASAVKGDFSPAIQLQGLMLAQSFNPAETQNENVIAAFTPARVTGLAMLFTRRDVLSENVTSAAQLEEQLSLYTWFLGGLAKLPAGIGLVDTAATRAFLDLCQELNSSIGVSSLLPVVAGNAAHTAVLTPADYALVTPLFATNEIIKELAGHPEIIANIPLSTVTTVAQGMLDDMGNRNVAKIAFADLQASVADVPTFAHALAALPGTQGLVTFTAEQTGISSPLYMRTPENGPLELLLIPLPPDGQTDFASLMRDFSSLLIGKPRAASVEVDRWFAETREPRAAQALPLVFEALAEQAKSDNEAFAFNAAKELAFMAGCYNQAWRSFLPEASQQRIDRVLAPAAP